MQNFLSTSKCHTYSSVNDKVKSDNHKSSSKKKSVNSYCCLFCKEIFSQKNVYQNHLRTHNKDTGLPYSCNICSKTFTVPARLTRHYRTHTGEKPYECEFCKKSFSVKENLSVHRRIHTNERPYKCDICPRAFEHSGKLHRHMRIHTGERPHKCSICYKTFIQSGQLVIHMRTHTGEKPYVCRSCNKGFTCSKQLKVHTRTHTGEKPYSCEICGKSFGYNHVLKLHQVAHYGEKIYKCTICNETFNSKKIMEAHIKSHSDTNIHKENGENLVFESVKASYNLNEIGKNIRNSTVSCKDKVTNLRSTKLYISFDNSKIATLQKMSEKFEHSSRDTHYSVLSCNSNDSLQCNIFSELQTNYSLIEDEYKNNDYTFDNNLQISSHNIDNWKSYSVNSFNNAAQPVQSTDLPKEGINASENKSNLTLPPRKRCKMILESMEIEKMKLLKGHNSVIQFAKAS